MKKQPVRIFDLLDLYREDYSSHYKVFNTFEKGAWKSYSAGDYITISEKLALGLLAVGVKRGTRIATVMYNCPEWNFFDMAIMMAGAVQVPIYPNISTESYRFILNDSQTEYLVISDRSIFDKIKPVLDQIPSLKNIFSIEKLEETSHWEELKEKGSLLSATYLPEIKSEITANDLAAIVYTSGTTGRPKGVMLSHGNLVSNFIALSKIPPLAPKDRILSFLPLCHVFERTASYTSQYLGLSVYYIQRPDELGETIKEVRPHAFTTVPRVLEKIYTAFIKKGRTLPPFRRRIFFWAVRQGHKFRPDNEWFYGIKLYIAEKIILRRWKKEMGGKIKVIVCGSASLQPRLSRIFWAAKMPVLEAYGLTETSPGITMQKFSRKQLRIGTVGSVLENVEVKIADDGEILTKGPGVMMGYYKRPERTAEVIDQEGWFHTGDIGEFVEGKFLRITDRKKEMFKTSSGRYIAPQVIEQKFKESPFIEHIIVIGENRKCTGALIVPDFQHLKAWCQIKHLPFISPQKAVSNPTIIRRYKKEIDRINQDFGQTEKIKKFVLIADEWNVATGEFSPTLKMRRKVIHEKYKDIINNMYDEGKTEFSGDMVSEVS